MYYFLHILKIQCPISDLPSVSYCCFLSICLSLRLLRTYVIAMIQDCTLCYCYTLVITDFYTCYMPYLTKLTSLSTFSLKLWTLDCLHKYVCILILVTDLTLQTKATNLSTFLDSEPWLVFFFFFLLGCGILVAG